MDTLNLILEYNKLKLVFRHTIKTETLPESTAEHSWSAAMIAFTLMSKLKTEFPGLDELKVLKLILIHDIVEIYAGDVLVFDIEARKEKAAVEREALLKLVGISPEFGKELFALWHEFEDKTSIEAKVAKACDNICPIFQRLSAGQSYFPMNINISKLNHAKHHHFEFSVTFLEMFEQLKTKLVAQSLIEDV